MDRFTGHGGRLAEARRRFPGAAEPWLDLSTGVNPLPYPAPLASAAARARLPDPRETAALEAAAARAFGLTPETVMTTAGGEAAIRLIAGTLPARRVAISEPTYGGHAEAWRAVGAEVISVAPGELDQAAASADIVVAVNPNNPDGARLQPETLLAAAAALAAHDGRLIVDEAYVEVEPHLAIANQVGPQWAAERVIGLRSFGKFYGLPGLRLGFVTAHPAMIERLRRRLGEWPVSADAIAAGLAAYADEAWAERTRTRLADDAARLDALLARAGFEIVGGTSLFRLAATDDAWRWFLRLCEAGILTRPFDYAPRWLRFGLPAAQDWPRLEAALMESA